MFEEFRKKQCEEVKLLVVHAQDFYNSQVRVRNSLVIPRPMRMPEAFNVWHATLKELGWEE